MREATTPLTSGISPTKREEIKRGAMACIVIPYIADLYKQDRTVWRKIAWYIHDQLPYDRMIFHPILCAINMCWNNIAEQRSCSPISRT